MFNFKSHLKYKSELSLKELFRVKAKELAGILSIKKPSTLISHLSLHVLFWLAYLCYFALMEGFYKSQYSTVLVIYLRNLPIMMACAYFTNYILVPFYLLKKKYLLFVLFFLFSAIFFSTCLKIIFFRYLIHEYYSGAGIRNYYQTGFFYLPYYLSHLLELYTVTFVFGFIKFFRNWYASQQNAIKLEQEKTAAELKFLKSQLNPHFLFNVLNNIYALALKNSNQTADMILRLSSMMDFILYESGNSRILFSKELKLIEDYIELEKLRYGDRLIFTMNVTECRNDFLIAPLLVFPFIENSFKHGASTNLGSPSIFINIKFNGNVLAILVENSNGTKDRESNSSYKEGIGLKNVMRRLELTYPGQYILNINNDDSIFSVHLELHVREQS